MFACAVCVGSRGCVWAVGRVRAHGSSKPLRYSLTCVAAHAPLSRMDSKSGRDSTRAREVRRRRGLREGEKSGRRGRDGNGEGARKLGAGGERWGGDRGCAHELEAGGGAREELLRLRAVLGLACAHTRGRSGAVQGK
eukprot:6180745-Pleurochrysis_carterae.AAC.1